MNLLKRQYILKAHTETAAFTLIELLVVVGIVIVLGLLAMTVNSKVRQTVAMTRSMANLRKISTGLHLYIADHDGYFPESAMDTTSGGKSVRFWFNALSCYIDGETDPQAASRLAERPSWQQCPGRPFSTPEKSGGFGVSVGYGWNHQFFGYQATEKYIDTMGWHSRLSEVEIPSETIIVGTNKEQETNGTVIGAGDLQNVCIYGNNPNSTRFEGAGLYLFVDGHIARLTPAEASWKGESGQIDRYLFKKHKNLPYPENKKPM